MRLDAVTAVLRPRQHWEAMDLGCALARRWWRPLYIAWFATLLPLALLLHLLCCQALWLTPWLLWWLKPLLDRVPLYILSHALFGEVPSLRQTLWQLPGLLGRQALRALTVGRLDAARSFHLPVQQLEHLRGRARRQRQRALDRQTRGMVWLTVICFHLEIAVDLAVVGLVWMLLPEFVQTDLSDWLDDATVFQQLWISLVGLIGLSVIEPLYVAAGFTLYLNRRTWQEAWDLEIGFRRLADRLRQVGGAGVIGGLLLLLWLPAPGPALAAEVETPPPLPSPFCEELAKERQRLAESTSPVQRALAEVLQSDELRRCTVQPIWRFKERAEESPPRTQWDWSLAGWLATAIEITLWALLVVSLAWLLWWWRNRPPGPRTPSARTVANPPPVRHGRAASFPPPSPTIGTDAWQLWQAGQPRAALALLYGGSLAGLSRRYGIVFGTEVTEDDCLRLATPALAQAPDCLDFLHQLTRTWQLTAYGHRPPPAATAQALCEQWPTYFGEPS